MDSFALLAGHLFGDYLLQNDWMALNKKQRTLPCLVHCAFYTAAIWVFTGWNPLALAVTFALHFAIDRTQMVRWWMQGIGQHEFAKPPMAPWSCIAVDQAMHVVCLCLTWRWCC